MLYHILTTYFLPGLLERPLLGEPSRGDMSGEPPSFLLPPSAVRLLTLGDMSEMAAERFLVSMDAGAVFLTIPLAWIMTTVSSRSRESVCLSVIEEEPGEPGDKDSQENWIW